MIKKLLSLILIFIIFLVVAPRQLFAHILETDGNIGAVLHIDPEDDPIVNQQSSFFFEFKDKQSKFSPQNCSCTFSIFQNDKELFTQSLFQNNTNPSLTSASIYYTFLQKGVYQIKVTGTPITPNAFQAFTLTYDIRVSREGSSTPSQQNQNWFSTHIPYLVGGGIIVLFAIFLLVFGKKEK